MTDDSHSPESGGDRRDGAPCPECEDGTLYVADAIFADCDSCNAAVLRNEVGL